MSKAVWTEVPSFRWDKWAARMLSASVLSQTDIFFRSFIVDHRIALFTLGARDRLVRLLCRRPPRLTRDGASIGRTTCQRSYYL
jgi:hypothetical protein